MLKWTIALLAAVGLGACSEAELGAPKAASPDLVRGHELYLRNGCAVCHGDSGRGDGKLAATLAPPPRDFADKTAYKQGGELAQIEASIRAGLGAMPAYAHLKPADLRAIARYIQSLQK